MAHALQTELILICHVLTGSSENTFSMNVHVHVKRIIRKMNRIFKIRLHFSQA